MDTNERKLLGHKMMNIYQVEMEHLNQNSELFENIIAETPPVDVVKTVTYHVENENLLYRIQQFSNKNHIGVMNFASPVKPGGGFLSGVNAQEEAICRNSFLYPELKQFTKEYYEKNLEDKHDYLYTPAIIYSHNVSVLRDEKEDRILSEVKYVDFVTVAAPNVSAMKMNNITLSPRKIKKDIIIKIQQTLRAFKNNRVRNLILGAFGCGVFGNDPAMVAKAFRDVLGRLEFLGAFDEVYFCILDNPQAQRAFEAVFM